MRESTSEGLPSEEEVRSLVAEIVDAVVREADGSITDESDGAAGVEEISAVGASSAEGAGSPAGAQTVAVGADHAGYPLKERIAFKLREEGWRVVDCGTGSQDPVDYPDFAHAVASKVGSGECDLGIMIDGAGIGASIAANKAAGARASLCYDLSSARNARRHNHANVLTLGAGLIGEGLAWQIVQEWLGAEWAGGRHARRVAKIDALDRRRTEASGGP